MQALNKGSITLFLGAGASACESFPTVFQFFEQVTLSQLVTAIRGRKIWVQLGSNKQYHRVP